MTKFPKQKHRNADRHPPGCMREYMRRWRAEQTQIKPHKIALHDAEQASSRAIQPKGVNGLMTSAILCSDEKNFAVDLSLPPDIQGACTMHVLKAIDLIEHMAKEAATTVEKAIGMIKVYERHQELEQSSRRSSPEEKDILRAEVAKLDEITLRNSTSRDIAATLVDRGAPIRPRVQGVLSIISKTRKQLLLNFDKQHAQAAE
jgi:hypothetical protein